MMLPIHRKSLAALSRMWLCTVRFEILLVVIAVLIMTGELASRAEAGDRVGNTFRDCPSCPEMVIIAPGTFVMGLPETEKGRDADEGQHTVAI